MKLGLIQTIAIILFFSSFGYTVIDIMLFNSISLNTMKYIDGITFLLMLLSFILGGILPVKDIDKDKDSY